MLDHQFVDTEAGGVISEVIGFQKFDVNSHTGDNIRKWITKILKLKMKIASKLVTVACHCHLGFEVGCYVSLNLNFD